MIPLPTSPGLHEIALTVDGIEVLATVSVPARRTKATPLVIALHYAGHGQPHYATGYLSSLVAPGLQGLGAIVIAPDCPDKSWSTARAEKVVLGLVDLAVAAWKIEPLPSGRPRVLLTGYSMGAIGTWRIASRHPERFAVALPVAGRPENVDAMKLPTYVIHGSDDALFPAAAAEHAVEALRARGIESWYAEGAGLGHYDTGRYLQLLTEATPWIAGQLEP